MKLDPINLGILGTGPQQWLNLTNFLVSSYDLSVKGLVINIIPGDMTRKVWTFNERQIRCLRRGQCDYSLDFQGFDFRNHETPESLKEEVSKMLVSLPSAGTPKSVVKETL